MNSAMLFCLAFNLLSVWGLIAMNLIALPAYAYVIFVHGRSNEGDSTDSLNETKSLFASPSRIKSVKMQIESPIDN
jgi:hypothetical protein